MKNVIRLFAVLLAVSFHQGVVAGSAVVFQSDFGQKDGAVSAMKGVAFGVDSKLPIYDLTHEVPTYNVWEASYRLYQSSSYWPVGTVIVSVDASPGALATTALEPALTVQPGGCSKVKPSFWW